MFEKGNYSKQQRKVIQWLVGDSLGVPWCPVLSCPHLLLPLTCLHCIPFYFLFSISGSSGKPNDRSCLLCGVLLQLPCFFSSRLVKGRINLFLTSLRGFEDSIHFIFIIRFATHFAFSLPNTNSSIRFWFFYWIIRLKTN